MSKITGREPQLPTDSPLTGLEPALGGQKPQPGIMYVGGFDLHHVAPTAAFVLDAVRLVTVEVYYRATSIRKHLQAIAVMTEKWGVRFWQSREQYLFSYPTIRMLNSHGVRILNDSIPLDVLYRNLVMTWENHYPGLVNRVIPFERLYHLIEPSYREDGRFQVLLHPDYETVLKAMALAVYAATRGPRFVENPFVGREANDNEEQG